jgi:hypothetical protein
MLVRERQQQLLAQQDFFKTPQNEVLVQTAEGKWIPYASWIASGRPPTMHMAQPQAGVRSPSLSSSLSCLLYQVTY